MLKSEGLILTIQYACSLHVRQHGEYSTKFTEHQIYSVSNLSEDQYC